MRVLKVISLAIVCAIAANAVVFGAMNTGIGYEFVFYGSIAFTELMLIYWFVKWIMGSSYYECDCDDECDWDYDDDEDDNERSDYYVRAPFYTARADENVNDNSDAPVNDETESAQSEDEKPDETIEKSETEKAFDNLVEKSKSF